MARAGFPNLLLLVYKWLSYGSRCVHTFLPSLLMKSKTSEHGRLFDPVPLRLQYDISAFNYFSQYCENVLMEGRVYFGSQFGSIVHHGVDGMRVGV